MTTTETQEVKQETKQEVTIEALQAEIAKLKDINKEAFAARDEVKSKLKTFEDERTAAEQARLVETGEFKKLFEEAEAKRVALETKINNEKIDSVLVAALTENGVNDLAIAKKLVDRTTIKVKDGEVDVESVKALIAGMKTEYKSLFSNVKTETVDTKKPAQNVEGVTYLEELRKLRESGKMTPFQLAQLRQKYGRD